MRLLSGIDHLEHFLLTNTLNLGQRHRKLSRFLIPLILNRTRKRLGIRLLRSVEQVLRQGRLGGFVGSRRLHILLLLRLDALPHLHLLGMALLLVELGSETAEVLGILGLLMDSTGLTLALALIMIETLAVLLLPALNIPVVTVVSWFLC